MPRGHSSRARPHPAGSASTPLISHPTPSAPPAAAAAVPSSLHTAVSSPPSQAVSSSSLPSSSLPATSTSSSSPTSASNAPPSQHPTTGMLAPRVTLPAGSLIDRLAQALAVPPAASTPPTATAEDQSRSSRGGRGARRGRGRDGRGGAGGGSAGEQPPASSAAPSNSVSSGLPLSSSSVAPISSDSASASLSPHGDARLCRLAGAQAAIDHELNATGQPPVVGDGAMPHHPRQPRSRRRGRGGSQAAGSGGASAVEKKQPDPQELPRMQHHQQHEHVFAAILDGAADSDIVAYVAQHNVDLLWLSTGQLHQRLVKRLGPPPCSSPASGQRGQQKRFAFQPFGWSAFAPFTALHTAVYAGRRALLSSLLSLSSSYVDARDSGKRTLLMWAVGLSSDPAIVQLLLDAGAELQAEDGVNLTCVHYACAVQSPLLSLLLSAPSCSADLVNHSDAQRVTPLHVAAKRGWTEGVQALLAAGAVSSFDAFGRQPVWYAYDCFKAEYARRIQREQRAAAPPDSAGRRKAGAEQRSAGAEVRHDERKEDSAAAPNGVGAGGRVGGTEDDLERTGRGSRRRRRRRAHDSSGGPSSVDPSAVVKDTNFGLVPYAPIKEQKESSQSVASSAQSGGRGRGRGRGTGGAGTRWVSKSRPAPPPVAPAVAEEHKSEPASALPAASASSSAPSALAAPPGPSSASADSLISNICLLARDQLSAIHTLLEQFEHPAVRMALISSFTPSAIIAHLEATTGSTAYYIDNAAVLLLLARHFTLDPQAFCTSPSPFPSLFRLLTLDADKRTQHTWAAALSIAPLSAEQTVAVAADIAREWRRSARVTLFCHAPLVESASEFCDSFFPVLLLFLTAGRSSEQAAADEATAHQFDFIWQLLDACLLDVGLEVEGGERLAVLVHCFFQWCQLHPTLQLRWEEETEHADTTTKDGAVRQHDEEGRRPGLEGGRTDEEEWDERRRQRTMIHFLHQDWTGRGRRKRGADTGKDVDALDSVVATVQQWREEPGKDDTAPTASRDGRKDRHRGGRRKADDANPPPVHDDSKEEKQQQPAAGGQQRSVLLPASLAEFLLQRSTSSGPSRRSRSHRYQSAGVSESSTPLLQRHPLLLSLLVRPVSPLFRAFVLRRHHSALLHLMRDSDGGFLSFARHFWFLLGIDGSVGTEMRLRFVRGAVDARWKSVGEEVVVAVSRLGVEGWDSEAEQEDCDDYSYSDDDDDDSDDTLEFDECSCDEPHPHPRHSSTSARPTPMLPPPSSTSAASASTAAAATAAGPATAQPPAGQEQLDLIMAQVLSASPHSLCTNLAARFVGERGVGDGPIRELLVLTSSLLFSPSCPCFALNPNGTAFHINPALPPAPAASSSSSGSSSGSVPPSPGPLKYFELAGRVLALCVLHSVPLGVSVSYSLLSLVCGCRVQLSDMKHFDAAIYRSLLHVIHTLSAQEQRARDRIASDDSSGPAAEEDDAPALYFTCDVLVEGKMVELPLIPNGSSVRVTAANLSQFLRLYTSYRIFPPHLAGYADAFAAGFNALIPVPVLSLLSPAVLRALLLGKEEAVTVDQMRAIVQYHDGFTADSPVITWFWQWVQGLGPEGRRRLWSFWSGHEVLGAGVLDRGVGGEAGWHIERAEEDDSARRARRRSGGQAAVARAAVEPLRLPQSSTCTSTLRLPRYTSREQLERAMSVALEFAAKGFGEA